MKSPAGNTTGLRNTAMGAAFNVGRGVQFLTPVIIALARGAWICTFPETKGKKLHATEPGV